MAVSGTLVKRIMVRITADDMDADEKLDAITRKADELAEKNPELRVKIDTAAAQAKMRVLRDELKAATAEPVDLDPALQAATEGRLDAMRTGLDELAGRADAFRESVDGDKDSLARLLGLRAEMEGMSESLSAPSFSPASLARLEAQFASVDAQFDRLRQDLAPSQEAWPALLDTGLSARLEALQAQIQEVSGRAADIELKGKESPDLQLMLTRLRLQLDELADKTVDPKFDLRGVARGEAEIEGISLQLDKLKAKADSSDAEGLLGRILVGRGNSESGGFLGGLVKWIPFIGEGLGSGVSSLGNIGAGAGEEGAEGAAPLLANPEGLGAAAGVVTALTPLIAGAAVELTGLVSGFAAAGAGAGAFALLAYPAIKQVTGALDDTQAQLAKLPKPEQDAVHGISGLKSEWDKLSSAFTPQAYKVFDDFLTIANELLPDVTPFANQFANSLDKILKRVEKFTESKQFKQWMSDFSQYVGPAMLAIGNGLSKLGPAIGKLMTELSKKDVVNAINVAFSTLTFSVDAFTFAVHGAMQAWDWISAQFSAKDNSGLMKTWDQLTTQFDQARHQLAEAGHDIASSFDTVRHAAATAGHDIAHGFDVARHGVATAGHDIETATDRAGSFVRTHWKEIAAWIGDPIGMAVMEIRTHTHQIARDFDGMRHDAATAIDGMRHDIASALAGARHDVAHWGDDVVTFFEQLPGRTVHALAQWAGDLFHSGDSSMKSMQHGVSQGAGSVWSFFEGLPGKVLGFLEQLPGRMISAGKSAIDGLVHGIEQGAADIPGVMKSLAGEVESYFTNPLKIFSPSRVMYEHGLMIPEGVALGIEAGSPRIRDAAAGMAHAVSAAALGSPAVTGSAASAAGTHVIIEIRGDAALRQWLKKSIRVTGGNVSIVGA